MALVNGIETIQTKITSGQSLSAAAPINPKRLVGIAMPAAWDAASLTFQVSPDGGTTWLELIGEVDPTLALPVNINYSAAANQYIALAGTMWYSITMLKVRSGTASVPVNQTADRIISLIVRPTL